MSHKIIFVLKSIISPTRASINPCLKALMPPYSRNAIPHIFVTVVIVVSLVLTLQILQENTGYYSDAQESPASSNPDQRRKIGFGDSDLSQCTTVLQPGGGLQVAINAANPGDIICLRAGEYTNSGAINMKSGSPKQARITIKSYPGESATIRAAIEHLDGDAPATLDGLVIDSHGASHASIRWWGDNLTVRYVSVTNRHDTGSNVSCIHMGASGGGGLAENAILEYSRMHNCGALLGSGRKGAHGLYNNNSMGAIIRHNIFDHNSGRGLQNYPNSVNSDEYGNILIENGWNIGFNGNARGVKFHNNVAANPARAWNVKVGADQYTKMTPGNTVTDNCLFSKGMGAPSGMQLIPPTTGSNNYIGDPKIVGNLETGEITVTNPECTAKLPPDSPYRGSPAKQPTVQPSIKRIVELIREILRILERM
jgi:hypothetical protein